ncbi:MAG: DUF4837 family protein [Flavobacteriales bacterium]
MLLVAALLSACGDRRARLPDSAGAPGEVLVVMDKGHWESEPGRAVRALLEQPMAGLPQREPLFRVAQCGPADFASVLQTHHSVLHASIGADSTGLWRIANAHAAPQLIVQVSAPTPEAWAATWTARAEEAIRGIEDHQRARLAALLRKQRDAALSGSLRAAFGIELDVPGGYRMVKLDSAFAWLERDRIMSGGGLEHNVVEGLLIHAHPYASDSTWNVRHLVDLRDSVTRARVPGPDPGSHMIVQRAFDPGNGAKPLDLMPLGRAVSLDGRFAYLMHGLYGMHGAKMGGPFVSLSAVYPSGRRFITAEGFVYAPHFNKAPYVRELEALLFSLRFAEQAGP